MCAMVVAQVGAHCSHHYREVRKEGSRQKQGHSLLQELPQCSYLLWLLHHLTIVFTWGLSVCMNLWECYRSKPKHVTKFSLEENSLMALWKAQAFLPKFRVSEVASELAFLHLPLGHRFSRGRFHHKLSTAAESTA